MAVLGIEHPFFNVLLQQEEILTIGIMIASGIVIQLVGIVMEDIAYRIGPYKHYNRDKAKEFKKEDFLDIEECAKNNDEKKKLGLQYVWEKKYEILATWTDRDQSQIEYRLAQFFMSHNIAIGMVIHLIWVIVFPLWIGSTMPEKIFENFGITVVVLSIITALSIYIPINRFRNSSRSLYAFYRKKLIDSKNTSED